VTTHWHGFAQLGTPWMDGVPGISQCLVLPQESFVYEFLAHTPGTFFYHSHFDLQRNEGAFGAIIIEFDGDAPYTWDQEVVLVFSDYYPDYGVSQEAGLIGAPFKWVGSPPRHLVNGQERYQLSLTQGKKYLFRIVGAQSLSFFQFTIPSHTFEIVEAQGVRTTSFVTNTIQLNAGERYSFIMTADSPGCYEVPIKMIDRAQIQEGEFYIQYTGSGCPAFNTSAPTQTGYTRPSGPANNPHNTTLVKTHASSVETIPAATRKILIAAVQVRTPDTPAGAIRWTVNGEASILKPVTPLMMNAFFDLDEPEEPTVFIDVKFGDVIDMVFQATPRSWDGGNEQHPMHLHGHNNWVLGYGGAGTPLPADASGLNLVNPPKLDTFLLPKLGWVWTRVVMDNPGIWFGHCHVSFHTPIGFFFVVRYDHTDKNHPFPPPPNDMPRCGKAPAYIAPEPEEPAGTVGVVASLAGGLLFALFLMCSL